MFIRKPGFILAAAVIMLVGGGAIVLVPGEVSPVHAAPGEVARAAANVMLKISLTGEGADGPEGKLYKMVCPGNGELTKIGAGERLPIPATTFNTSQTVGSNMVPVTSYSYQMVGFTAHMMAEVLGDGRIALKGSIEDSSVAGYVETTIGARLPRISTYEHSFETVLDPEEPMRTTVFGDPASGPLQIEVVAKVIG